MATFEIQGPDGKVYEVEAPDAQSAVKALSSFVKKVEPSAPNPDGTFGQVPPDMFLNPATGQMTSRELLKGNLPDLGALDASVSGGMQGNLLGWGDEFAGLVGGGVDTLLGRGDFADNYRFNKELNRAQLEKAREGYPKASMAGEVAGTLPVPVPGRGGVAGGIATGGLLGGLYGAGASEDDARGQGAKAGTAIGAAVGAALPLLGAIAGKVGKGRAAGKIAKAAPTTEELRRMGRAEYDAIDSAGVQIDPKAFERNRQEIIDYLRANTGFDELPGAGSLTPKAGRTMGIMEEASKAMAAEPTAALPFKALDQMRRQAGAAASDFTNKTDQAAGSAIIEKLDEFIATLKPDDVVAGDAQALQTAIPKARELWARMSRSQLVDDAIEASQNYVNGPGAGLRYQFKRILSNKKLARGFSAEEKAIMRKIATGSGGERIMRFLGSGIGSPIATAAGATFGASLGPVGGITGGLLGALGSAGARQISENILMKRAELARALVAARSSSAPVLQLPGPKAPVANRGLAPIIGLTQQ
jgi:hypothetical protein